MPTVPAINCPFTETEVAQHIPIHQFTYAGDKVLLVKCVRRGGKSYNDFQWPASGTATTPNWEPKPTCESGGFFGWAWGLNLGGGKEPDYHGDWIVFAADPASVIDLVDKAKAGPSVDVVYYGSWHGALAYTKKGREAWLEQMFAAACARAEQGREKATGDRSAAALTGSLGSIEVGPTAAGVVTADEFDWIVHLGAVVLHRWSCGHAVLTTEGLTEGSRVHVAKGRVQQ